MSGEYCIGNNCYCSADPSLADASFPAMPKDTPSAPVSKIAEPLLYSASKELARAARIDEADADVIFSILITIPFALPARRSFGGSLSKGEQLDLSRFKPEELKDIIASRLALNDIEATLFESAIDAVVGLREAHLVCMVDASASSAIKPAACEDGTYYHLKTPLGIWMDIEAKDGFVRLVIDKKTFKNREEESYISSLGNETVFSENYSGSLFVSGNSLGIERLTLNPLGLLEGMGSTTEEVITFASALLLIIGYFGGKKVRGLAPQYGFAPALAGGGIWHGSFRPVSLEAYENAPVIRLGRGTAAALSAGAGDAKGGAKPPARGTPNKPPTKTPDEFPVSETATTIEMQAVNPAKPPPLPPPLPKGRSPKPPSLPSTARPPSSTVFMPAVKGGGQTLNVATRHERALLEKLIPAEPAIGRGENAWPPLTGIVKDPSQFKDAAPLPGQFEKGQPRVLWRLPSGAIAGGREGYFDTGTGAAGRMFGYTVGGTRKNQDAVGYLSGQQMFFMAVADGVGGVPKGEVAAESLVTSLMRYVSGRPSGNIVNELTSLSLAMPSLGVPQNAQATLAGARIVSVRGLYYVEIVTVGDAQALIARPGKGLVFYTQPQTLAFFSNRNRPSAIERTMGEFTEALGKREMIATSVASGQILPREEVNVSRLPLCQNDVVAIYSDGIGKNFTPWMLARFLIDPEYSVGALGRSLARAAWDAMNAKEIIVSAGNHSAAIEPAVDNFGFGVLQITAPTRPLTASDRVFLDPSHEYLLK